MTVLTLPSTRQEAWRWADIDGIAAAASLPRAESRDADAFWLDLPGDRLLFVDGVLHDSSRRQRAELAEVAASDHDLAARASGRGWRLALSADAVADPVQVVHLSTGGDNHLPAEILLADDAVGTVIETYAGRGWANRFARVSLGKAARLQRAVRLLQEEGFTSTRDEAELGTGASLVQIVLGAGDAGSRVDAQINVGEGGFAEYGGALLTRHSQRQECAVAIRHAAPNGQSRQYWRAVAANQSAASLAARVEVARHAQKTDGEQSLRGILLQRTATVNLKPELEIFADDVKCAHGATVGELDDRALFYMQSRGVPKPRAQALLTRAFVADAIGRFGNEAIADAMMADADAWLERAL
ncbi:MAG TPA: SufD family Fe-S cluster assembly protein [Sphingomonas sp.]|jgi:Fe-S cluster assembly protein SufD